MNNNLEKIYTEHLGKKVHCGYVFPDLVYNNASRDPVLIQSNPSGLNLIPFRIKDAHKVKSLEPHVDEIITRFLLNLHTPTKIEPNSSLDTYRQFIQLKKDLIVSSYKMDGVLDTLRNAILHGLELGQELTTNNGLKTSPCINKVKISNLYEKNNGKYVSVDNYKRLALFGYHIRIQHEHHNSFYYNIDIHNFYQDFITLFMNDQILCRLNKFNRLNLNFKETPLAVRKKYILTINSTSDAMLKALRSLVNEKIKFDSVVF